MKELGGLLDDAEESGREEASCDYPNLPQTDDIPDEEYRKLERNLIRAGRARATGSIYNLRGRNAKRFARTWAMGYLANCDLFERELEDEEDDNEEA